MDNRVNLAIFADKFDDKSRTSEGFGNMKISRNQIPRSTETEILKKFMKI